MNQVMAYQILFLFLVIWKFTARKTIQEIENSNEN